MKEVVFSLQNCSAIYILVLRLGSPAKRLIAELPDVSLPVLQLSLSDI